VNAHLYVRRAIARSQEGTPTGTWSWSDPADLPFPARDTLQRHVAVHDRSRDKDRQESQSRRVKHACRKCSQSKQRCDGKKPCNRCVQKNLGCSYRVSQSPEASSKERQNHLRLPNCHSLPENGTKTWTPRTTPTYPRTIRLDPHNPSCHESTMIK
jgi:hypothetical protein